MVSVLLQSSLIDTCVVESMGTLSYSYFHLYTEPYNEPSSRKETTDPLNMQENVSISVLASIHQLCKVNTQCILASNYRNGSTLLFLSQIPWGYVDLSPGLHPAVYAVIYTARPGIVYQVWVWLSGNLVPRLLPPPYLIACSMQIRSLEIWSYAVTSGRQRVDTWGWCPAKNLKALSCTISPRTEGQSKWE